MLGGGGGGFHVIRNMYGKTPREGNIPKPETQNLASHNHLFVTHRRTPPHTHKTHTHSHTDITTITEMTHRNLCIFEMSFKN